MKRMKKGMLSVVICLQAEGKSDAGSSHDAAAGTPIGFICLMGPPEGMGYVFRIACLARARSWLLSALPSRLFWTCDLMQHLDSADRRAISDTTATPWSV